MIHVVPILVDQTLDSLSSSARLRSRVRHSATEPHVIADEILTRRILELILDVSLFHLEMAVHIATVVSLPAFRHLLMLHPHGQGLRVLLV